jgi:hypothetical protein
MNREDVIRLLGQPNKVIRTNFDITKEVFDDLIVFYSDKDDQVAEILIRDSMKEVQLSGLNILNKKKLSNFINSQKEFFKKFDNAIISVKYGFSVSGLTGEEPFSVSIFKKGWWDDYKNEMRNL